MPSLSLSLSHYWSSGSKWASFNAVDQPPIFSSSLSSLSSLQEKGVKVIIPSRDQIGAYPEPHYSQKFLFSPL